MIVLPWPDKRLSPNARVHWQVLAVVKRKARLVAYWTAMSDIPLEARQSLAQGEGHIPVSITFHPPDKRGRDMDNAIASMKASMDGIADAIGTSDRRFQPSYRWGEPAKPGRVEVVFTPLSEG